MHLVVLGEIAVLAETLGIVRSVCVTAEPRLLGASLSMVAVHAHTFRVVDPIFVRAIDDSA